MSRIMAQQTALEWTLAVASQLQSETINVLDSEDWDTMADDLNAIAAYARYKAEQLRDEEEDR